MNGFFITRNLQGAAYVLTLGAPYPTTRADETDKPGVVSFTFEDPDGEWQREARGLDLSNPEADRCHVPCARLFAAQKLLRDDVNRALGREHSGVRR